MSRVVVDESACVFSFFSSLLSFVLHLLLSFPSLKAPISSLSPRGVLTLRNKMRSAIALGRVAAMPSCSRRAASSAPAPARRVAVKVKIEQLFSLSFSSLPLDLEKRERETERRMPFPALLLSPRQFSAI